MPPPSETPRCAGGGGELLGFRHSSTLAAIPSLSLSHSSFDLNTFFSFPLRFFLSSTRFSFTIFVFLRFANSANRRAVRARSLARSRPDEDEATVGRTKYERPRRGRLMNDERRRPSVRPSRRC